MILHELVTSFHYCQGFSKCTYIRDRRHQQATAYAPLRSFGHSQVALTSSDRYLYHLTPKRRHVLHGERNYCLISRYLNVQGSAGGSQRDLRSLLDES